jgi:hypothetical protein
MGKGITPAYKREIADKFLKWLVTNNEFWCSKTSVVVRKASDELDIPMYDMWKGYKLLRTMGRLALNNPNGKQGFSIIDETPLTIYQLRTDNFKKQIQEETLTQILKLLRKQYKDTFAKCAKQILTKP